MLFLENGYNVITYDQRSTNGNSADYTTFGYWEKYDLIDWINYVEEEAPGQKIVDTYTTMRYNIAKLVCGAR